VTLSVPIRRRAEEYTARHADLIEKGLETARSVLDVGDAGIAAHLLNVPEDAVRWIAGPRRQR